MTIDTPINPSAIYTSADLLAYYKQVKRGDFSKKITNTKILTAYNLMMKNRKANALALFNIDKEKITPKEITDLIQKGANVNAQDGYGSTVLMVFAAKGRADIVEELLKNNANPDLTKDISPLMYAAYQGYSDCVDMLIKYGANVFLTDTNGLKALNYAHNFNKGNVARRLVKAEAEQSVKIKNGTFKGYTPNTDDLIQDAELKKVIEGFYPNKIATCSGVIVAIRTANNTYTKTNS